MARDSPLELEITNSPAGKKKPGNPLAEQFFFFANWSFRLKRYDILATLSRSCGQRSRQIRLKPATDYFTRATAPDGKFEAWFEHWEGRKRGVNREKEF